MGTPAESPPTQVVVIDVDRPFSVPNELVRARLAGKGAFTTTRFAELAIGDVRIAVVAPWFEGGRLVDDDVVGLVFRRTDTAWVAGEELSLSSRDGRAKVDALEGPWSLEVARACGAPADALATRANDALARFSAAGADMTAAAKAWVDFSTLWSLDDAVFDDTPTSVLQGLGAAGGRFTCTGDTPTCAMSMGDKSMPVPTEPCGANWVFKLPKK